MNRERAQELLQAVAEGRVSPESALTALVHAPTLELADATLDLHRALRQGFPEVVLADGKSIEQTVSIVTRFVEEGQGVLVTRASAGQRAAICQAHPSAESNEIARTVLIASSPEPAPVAGPVLVITAGTSDLPVAEEAMVTLAAQGVQARRVMDVGVAGVHRLTPHLPAISGAVAVIVVAGMDGALASVVGGLASCPVIAVPTSVGYGASLGGIAALLAMLSSCAAGLSVVNIDNGFGAAMAAARIARGVSDARAAATHVEARQALGAVSSSR